MEMTFPERRRLLSHRKVAFRTIASSQGLKSGPTKTVVRTECAQIGFLHDVLVVMAAQNTVTVEWD